MSVSSAGEISRRPASGFVWMAGQGGYGIQTAPAAGAALAALATGGVLPAELTALGLGQEQLLPDRFRL